MNYKGKLLISHPRLPKTSWFHNSVIYIYSDDPVNGTMGVCINKPSSTTIAEIYHERNQEYLDKYSMIYTGGPVSMHSLIMLHTNEWACQNTIDAGSELLITSDYEMLDRLQVGDFPSFWRLFVGVCAWMPGQLDMELSAEYPYKPENSWLIADSSVENIFIPDDDEQWDYALHLSSKQLFERYLD